MISPSQHVLLEAIKASLFGGEPDYPEDTNWEEVVTEAKAQTVLSLISPVIPIQDDSVDQCKAAYMQLMYEQDKAINLLDSSCIPCVILKGCSAAVYYPKPFLRAMGDIDLLVPRNMIREAMNIFESNGYSYMHGKKDDGSLIENERNVVYTKNGVVIELHYRFSSEGYDIDDDLKNAVFKREYANLFGYSFPMFPMVENGMVLIGHINQHLSNNELGLRQIIDWALYIHAAKRNTIWNEVFIPKVNNAGLLILAAHVTKMCNTYLGLPEVVDWGIDVDLVLVDELLEIVLTDGNFGRRAESSIAEDEKRIRRVTYGIKRHGFFRYLQIVGIAKNESLRRNCVLRLCAFFYGFFIIIGKGVKAVVSKRGLGKQMSAGKKRYELYKKLGVRNGEK